MKTAPDGEKRWTIVLSTDMVDFTHVTQTIGNEKAFSLLQEILGIARAAIVANGGHVVDTAGDGILAAFGAPRSLEHPAALSCQAALNFRHALATQADRLKNQYGITPQFRTGIAGGEAMVAFVDDDTIKIVGDPVNKAARLQSLAKPNDILIGESIFQEAEGLIQAQPAGTAEIKGFASPVAFYALEKVFADQTRFRGIQRRGIVAFVARRAELDHALSVLNRQTHPQILVVRGPPGIGKSRLTHEVTNRLSPGQAAYTGQSAPNGQQSFAPVYEMLRQALNLTSEMSQSDILRQADLAYPGLCDPAALATVLAPPSADGDELNRALEERRLLRDLLIGISAADTCIFVLEDAHWADASTAALLDMIRSTPLPLIITGRPEFAPDWLTDPDVDVIDLDPLDETDIAAIVNARLDDPVAPALSALIANKAEGIPLIAEEILRALQHNDQLEFSAAGLNLRETDTSLVTGNVAHLVLSRFDQQDPAIKRRLQIAATIGRDFSADLLARATGDTAAVQDFAGLLEERGAGQWRFTHALVRDAVYDSLLMAEKTRIHLKVAEALEAAQDPNNARIAEHFQLAGEDDRAVPHLIAAAEQNLRVYALSEAVSACEAAMTVIEKDPQIVDEPTFGRLASTWMRALNASAQFMVSNTVVPRLLPRLENAPYSRTLPITRTFAAINLAHLRDYPKALSFAQAALHAAEENQDPVGAAWAKLALMRIYEETYMEPPDVIAKLADEIMPVAEKHGDRHLGMNALYVKSAMYRSSGRKKEALATSEQISEFAKLYNDRRARGFASWSQAVVFAVEGNPEALRDITNRAFEDVIPGTSDEYAWLACAGYGAIMLDPPEQAWPQLLSIQEKFRPTGDFNIIHSSIYTQGMLSFKQGRVAQGWRTFCDLVADAEARTNVNMIRQVRIARAEILLILSGLIDAAAETPPGRPTYPRLRPGLRDIAIFAKLRLTARRIAKEDYHRCLELDPLQYGTHFARAKIGLGLLANAKGDAKAARALIMAGYESAVAEDLTILIDRAERALSSLKG